MEKIQIAKEFYLSVTLDRKAGKPAVIYSPEGGMNIEEVAKTNPEHIHKIHIDMSVGLKDSDLK